MTTGFEPMFVRDPIGLVGPEDVPQGTCFTVTGRDRGALAEYTDLDLLLELRARGRLGRVVGESVIHEDHSRDQFRPPLDYQVRHTFKSIAHELTAKFMRDERPTGSKVEEGHFDRGSYRSFHRQDRKVYIPLNFVVGKL